MQAFQPAVIVVNAIWPAGAFVADQLKIPKVALSVLAPCVPMVNAASHAGAWPALMPVVPRWQSVPMVSQPAAYILSCLSTHP